RLHFGEGEAVQFGASRKKKSSLFLLPIPPIIPEWRAVSVKTDQPDVVGLGAIAEKKISVIELRDPGKVLLDGWIYHLPCGAPGRKGYCFDHIFAGMDRHIAGIDFVAGRDHLFLAAGNILLDHRSRVAAYRRLQIERFAVQCESERRQNFFRTDF